MSTEQEININWFVYIGKAFSKFSKTLITTAVLSCLGTLIYFVWANASLPADSKKINSVQQGLNSLNSKDSAKTIILILLKDKINSIENNQKDMKEDMKEGMKEIYKELHEINRNTK